MPRREEHVFRKGDFYLIEPGVVYAQKSGPNTEILFTKVPPGNDKVPVETSSEVEAWFQEPIRTVNGARDCAIREVREETGFQIRITGLIGTYTNSRILIAYSDGEIRQEFTLV